MPQKVMPCLWFDDRIEEAVDFYVSVFPDAKVSDISRYGEAGPLEKGKVLTAMFEIAGQKFMALNGGPRFPFTEAVSFKIDCESEEEVDYYWEKLLTGGGEESMCGWLKDRFGLSWQVVPTILITYMKDKDRAKADRVMQAMLQMRKIDVPKLKQAYEGR